MEKTDEWLNANHSDSDKEDFYSVDSGENENKNNMNKNTDLLSDEEGSTEFKEDKNNYLFQSNKNIFHKYGLISQCVIMLNSFEKWNKSDMFALNNNILDNEEEEEIQFCLNSNTKTEKFDYSNYQGSLCIFDKKFKDINVDKTLLNKYIKSLIYFPSSKEEFDKLKIKNKKFVFNFNWYSYLKIYQSILSNFILEIKVHNFLTKELKLEIDSNPILKAQSFIVIDKIHLNILKRDTIGLFIDELLPISQINTLPDLSYLIENFPSVISYLDQYESNDNTFKISHIIPPLSSHMVLQCLNFYESKKYEEKIKLKPVSILLDFIELLNRFNIMKSSLVVLQFKDIIFEKEIIEMMFEFEKKPNDEDIKQGYKVNNCYYIKRQDKNCIIFVTIDKKYIQSNLENNYDNVYKGISEFFNIYGNRGMIITIPDRQKNLFAIGIKNEYLIVLNNEEKESNSNQRHVTFDKVNDAEKYDGIIKGYEISKENITLVQLLSCSIEQIVMVFVCKTVSDIKQMFGDIKKYNEMSFKLFSFYQMYGDTAESYLYNESENSVSSKISKVKQVEAKAIPSIELSDFS